MKQPASEGKQPVTGAQMLEAVLNTAVGAIITIDDRGIMQHANPATQKLFGYALDELIGQNVSMLMPEPHRSAHDGYLHNHITTGVKKIIGIGRDVEGQRKDGSLFPMHLSVSAFTVEGKHYFAGIVHDLTERANLQGQMSRQWSLFEAVFNHVPDALIITGDDRNITLCNSAVSRLFGIEPGELLRRNMRDLYASDEDFERVGALRAKLKADETVEPVLATFKRISGETFPGQVVGARILDKAGNSFGFVGLIRDVSQELEHQKVLHHAQRMEAFGQLTGGIAHDFNNLLTVMTGNHELLEMRLKDEKERDLLARAQSAAEMGARLTERLLAFARRSQLETVAMNLNSQVLSVGELLKRTLGEQIAFSAVLTPQLWSVVADPGEIENTILNLAINARDAMPDGGKLTVETANVSVEDGAVGFVERLPPGEYVRLSVSDTGTGMTPEVAARAIEPFFTTKEPGKGTGLGLSSIYGIAQQLGGTLTIYSEVGRGTTVNVYLPRAHEGAGDIQTSTSSDTPVSAGETVLLVEDNPEVREVTASRLEELGYRVCETTSGDEAIAFLQTDRHVDIVFSDVVMAGGVSGFDVTRWVRANNPELKILLTSGFASDVLNAEKAPIPDVEILRKPYNRSELARALRRTLDS